MVFLENSSKMSNFTVGSLCEDCVLNGSQNYLKFFYINLEEQIIKCESSRCMFPYLRKSISNSTESKPSQCTLFLDEFIEQSLQQIYESPAKPPIIKCPAKVEKEPELPDMYDFSSIFMNHPIKTEVKEKPIMFQTIKQEHNVLPVVLESKVAKNSSSAGLKIEDSEPKAPIKTKRKAQPQLLQTSRISKCFSDVKPKYVKSTKTKAPSVRIEPVFVIEPRSGQSMRPLDLIKRYIQNK